ncbi:MAG: peptidoglycan DD-metalloendopeptidase family protein [Candidatus Gracilibacteria bacterium]|nr:peptidoglycan DD-metalloendopeptidase family protein [Candidatus Gracilibacteria bacterium]
MNRFLVVPFLKSFRYTLHSPFGFQVLSLGFLLAFLLSFRPAYFVGVPERFEAEFFGGPSVRFSISEEGFLDNFSGVNTAGLHEFLLRDEEGNVIVKVEPKKRTETLSYNVRSGETIISVAHKFGLKVSTLLWANKLTSKQSLTVGQSLRIPPKDGIYYTVQNNDELAEVAKAHNVDIEKIATYNGIKTDGVLTVGKELFIPDAKKTFIPRSTGTDSSALASLGFELRRPTKGVISQGFHKQHYAIDIANRLNSPVYAAASGTVIRSSDGWNYGYGRYIIVDHGNGVQTLYAHLNSRKIEEGAEIKTGQLIGLMGNTGNVFGPTGIHLHFEVRIRGRKVNPFNYF